VCGHSRNRSLSGTSDISEAGYLVIKPQTTELDYASKTAEYFVDARPEMLSFVPTNCRRLLDVGCGTGTFGASLKQDRPVEVWGVEPFASAAVKAAGKLDRVITGPFGPETDLPVGTFDCIVFNDVLEHMVAPDQALRYAKTLLSAGGTILASIPNVRYLPVLWQLAVCGRWDYEDCGVLDKTHLRFFTRSSLLRMFQDEGYTVKSIDGINPYQGIPNVRRRLWRVYRIVNAVAFGQLSDMKYLQFAVVAKPSVASGI
jgi:2-polyprenyl-3-methyl-5-hydroxy-6-metoxy-1,4-benzoquinol methylase